MKKCLSFIIVFFAIIALIITGCGGGSDFVKSNNPGHVSESIIPVSNEGGIDGYTQSGLHIKAENGTFESNVKVNITENKLFEGMSREFFNTSSLFTISAEKTVTNSFGGETKTKVTSVKKPVIITVPNNSTQSGIYYVGTRADSNKAWKYMLLNDNNSYNNPLPVFSRLSENNNAKEFYVSTYNVDFQFSVFVETEPDPNKTVITDFMAEAEPSAYESVDGKYKDDIKIKATVLGDNLNNLSSGNFTVEIGFLNNRKDEFSQSTFPINGASARYEVSEPNAGAGNSFKHTIILTNISDFSNNTLSFVLGASKLTQEDFPTDFTVTLKVDESPKVVAFEKTKGIILKSDKNQIKIVSTNPLNGATNVSTEAGNITIAFDKELANDNSWVTFVSLTTGNSVIPVKVAYKNKTLTISHDELEKATSYNLQLKGGLKSVEADTETEAFELTFTTQSQPTTVTATMTSPESTNAPLAAKVVIAFSENIKWEENSKNLVTLSDDTAKVECNYTYANKTLTLTPTAELLFNKTYTVKISKYLTQYSNAKLQSDLQFEFTTVESAGTPSITPDQTMSSDYGYYLVANQKFQIDFNKIIVDENTAKHKIYMQKNGAAFSQYAVEFDADKRIATINVEAPFEADKTYRVGVTEFTDSDGSLVKSAEKSVNALPTMTASIEIKDSATDWKNASGSNELALEGKIRVKLNQSIDPSFVKFVDKNGIEMTAPFIANKTTAKSDTIEFDYSGLTYKTTYGIIVSCDDAVTGQKFESGTHTFLTTYPRVLVLENPSLEPSASNPWLVYCAEAFNQIREPEFLGEGYYYKQMDDIDLSPSVYASDYNKSTTGWKPLGVMGETINTPFIGHYDGNDMTIKNLTCNVQSDDTDSTPSLFGIIENGSVSNLGLEDVNLKGGFGVAAIAGLAENTTITNCHTTGEINGTNYIGGLIGQLRSGNIDDCNTTNLIIKGSINVGGIVGHFGMSENSDNIVATMKNCHSINISLEASGQDAGIEGNIGGIVGLNGGKIINCSSSGKVISDECNVSGIVGCNGYWGSGYNLYGFVDSAKTTCEVKGYDFVAGIIGYNFGNCTEYKLSFDGNIDPDFYKEPDPYGDPPYNPWYKDQIVNDAVPL